jgi:hypothetical protein
LKLLSVHATTIGFTVAAPSNELFKESAFVTLGKAAVTVHVVKFCVEITLVALENRNWEPV